MQWIRHHNPDLVVLDDNGKEKERIDLQGLTAAKLESMCAFGAVERAAPTLPPAAVRAMRHPSPFGLACSVDAGSSRRASSAGRHRHL